jgi:hypothetical protein
MNDWLEGLTIGLAIGIPIGFTIRDVLHRTWAVVREHGSA